MKATSNPGSPKPLNPPVRVPGGASPTHHGDNPAPALGTARVGVYSRGAEWDDARASFLADFQDGGPHDTIRAWISEAMDQHAARTPQERAAFARDPSSRTGRGVSRIYPIAAATVAAMHEAIAADAEADQRSTDSIWCGEAIAAAVAATKRRRGGELPPPPHRLPARLRRRATSSQTEGEPAMPTPSTEPAVLGLGGVGHGPPLLADPLDEQFTTAHDEPGITVGHEDLRSVGDLDITHRTRRSSLTSNTHPWCHQPPGRVHLAGYAALKEAEARRCFD